MFFAAEKFVTVTVRAKFATVPHMDRRLAVKHLKARNWKSGEFKVTSDPFVKRDLCVIVRGKNGNPLEKLAHSKNIL